MNEPVNAAPARSRSPGRPRKQKTARQLLARFLNEPLPPGAAKLGCLSAWAEGGEDANAPGPEEAAAPARGKKAAAPERGRVAAAGQSALPLRMYEGMLLAQMARALEGDLKALQFIRETMGEREEEKARPQSETLSAGDRALLQKLAARLGLEEEP